MRMTTVILSGKLGEQFGRRWQFNLAYVGQAVNALEAARPGFKAAILKMNRHMFVVRLGKRQLSSKYLALPANGKTIRITPVMEGASNSKGIIETITGVVLIAAGIVLNLYGVPVGTYLIQAGLVLTLGGIATLLSPSPTQAGLGDTKNKKSYIFNGAANSLEQGGPIAIPFGEIMVGTSILSVDIEATDIRHGSNTGGGNSGTGNSAVPGSPNAPANPAYEHHSVSTQ